MGMIRAVELTEAEIGKHLALSLMKKEAKMSEDHGEVAEALTFVLMTHPGVGEL